MHIANHTPPNILFVDDEQQNLQVVLRFFEDHPETILYAPNGKIAVETAQKHLPDLIIMDWAMPVMNGIEALQALQAQESTRGIPVIMATGIMTSQEDLKTALDAGAVDFLRKPFDPLEFQGRVGTALRLAASYKEIHELVQDRERALAAQAIQLHEQENLLEDMEKDLQGMEQLAKGPLQQQLSELRKQVKHLLGLRDSWDRFLVQFEKVHPTFSKNLLERCPDLTVNDQKLCSYLRIGLDNQEMAQLMAIETASVKKTPTTAKEKTEPRG